MMVNHWLIMAGWWLTYPSEKYESPVGMMTFPIIGKIKHGGNHQPVTHRKRFKYNSSKLDPNIHRDLWRSSQGSSSRMVAVECAISYSCYNYIRLWYVKISIDRYSFRSLIAMLSMFASYTYPFDLWNNSHARCSLTSLINVYLSH